MRWKLDANGVIVPTIDGITVDYMTPEEMEVDLGARLKALRLSRNIDQATLAERAGISVRALRKLETGDGPP